MDLPFAAGVFPPPVLVLVAKLDISLRAECSAFSRYPQRNMDSDIDRLIEATGASVPLAARIIGLIVESGASKLEVISALDIVKVTLPRLKISLDQELPSRA